MSCVFQRCFMSSFMAWTFLSLFLSLFFHRSLNCAHSVFLLTPTLLSYLFGFDVNVVSSAVSWGEHEIIVLFCREREKSEGKRLLMTVDEDDNDRLMRRSSRSVSFWVSTVSVNRTRGIKALPFLLQTMCKNICVDRTTLFFFLFQVKLQFISALLWLILHLELEVSDSFFIYNVMHDFESQDKERFLVF